MTLAATFGTGGSEPYATALRRPDSLDTDSNLLFLRDTRGGASDRRVTMDVSRWNADADDADLTLLLSVTGPLLDIGCGPGRMVRAAEALGILAVGIDVSAAAIDVASGLGGVFYQGTVFDPVPGEGDWQTALLVDGNVGIGGSIAGLLHRCRQLLAPEGEIVVELDPDPDHEDHYLGQVVDAAGRASATFPWAEIGLNRIVRLLPQLQLELVQSWDIDGRSFCRLAKTTR